VATLASGVYSPKQNVVVTHWPKPDANGDGEQMWDGEDEIRDRNENPVRSYNPPEGFVAVDSRDGSGTTVGKTYCRRENGNGPIKRTPTGEAVNIYHGETLLEYPDGTIRKLKTDKERKQFLDGHALAE